MTRYFAKKDTWFDEGTEAVLIDDYQKNHHPVWRAGLFKGFVDGELDEEVCNFEEFDIVEE